LSNPSDD